MERNDSFGTTTTAGSEGPSASSSRRSSRTNSTKSIFRASERPAFDIMDPNVKRQQKEWEDLLYVEGGSIPYDPEDIFGDVTQKHLCAAIWLSDALHARAVDYPRSDEELEKLARGRSSTMRDLFNAAAIFQILSPFLHRPYCSGTTNFDDDSTGWGWFVAGGLPSMKALSLIDLVCVSVFGYDLYLFLSVNSTKKSIVTHPWTLLRAAGSALLFGGIIATLVDVYDFQLYLRSFFPFFLISRRGNLKLMMQGLMHSAYYIRPVLQALVGLLTMWGLLGYFMFRHLEESGHIFTTPGHSIITALHLFTSRPFTLRALLSLNEPTQASSTLYFVTLTLATDVLCTAFVIAVGNRQYKLFAGRVLRKRLLDRKRAVVLVYFAFAKLQPPEDGNAVESLDGDHGFPYRDWMKIMVHLKDSRYRLTKADAENIFFMEDTDMSEHVSIDGFFRMMGSVAARIKFKVRAKEDEGRKKEPSMTVTTAMKDPEVSMSDTHGERDKVLDGQGGVERSLEHKTSSPLHDEGSDSAGRSSWQTAAERGARSSVGGLVPPKPSQSPGIPVKINTAFHPRGGPLSEPAPQTIIVEGKSRDDSKRSDSPPPLRPRRMTAEDADLIGRSRSESNVEAEREANRGQNSKEVYSSSARTVAQRLNSPELLMGGVDGDHWIRDSDSSSTEATAKEAQDRYDEENIKHWEPVVGYSLARQGVRAVRAIRKVVGARLVVTLPTVSMLTLLKDDNSEEKKTPAMYEIPIYNTFFITTLHILLLFWLGRASDPRHTARCMAAGWALQVVFMADSLLKFLLYGPLGIGRSRLSRAVNVSTNLSTLIAMFLLQEQIYVKGTGSGSEDSFKPSVLLITVILTQSMRLWQLFFVFNEQSIFEDILPTLTRALFVFFSVIFFFAVFAHGLFCDDMCSTCDDVINADDDASQWVEFSEILLFRTILQSTFTMFQLTILSNWSIVMGAAAKAAGWRAYAFFYVYRLVMTLCVLPLLVSFMMNSFISAVTKQEELKRLKRNDHETVRKFQEALEMNFHDDIGVSEEKKALERVSRTLGHSDEQSDTGSKPMLDRDTLTSLRSRYTNSRFSKDRGSELSTPDENLSSRSYSHGGSEVDLQNDSWHSSSILSRVKGMLPAIHFDTSDNSVSSKTYDIQSKSAQSSAPSMLQIWGAVDQIPANPAGGEGGDDRRAQTPSVRRSSASLLRERESERQTVYE